MTEKESDALLLDKIDEILTSDKREIRKLIELFSLFKQFQLPNLRKYYYAGFENRGQSFTLYHHKQTIES